MTCTVFLVRHAAHGELGRCLTGRRDGVPLSAAGRRQAAALALRLAGEGLAGIYASPRRRARETAEAIARGCGLKAEIAAGLDEIDFGDWTGRSFDSLAGDSLWQEWNERRGTARPPGGEAMAEAALRTAAEIERLAARHDGSRIALVGHCDPIRGAVARFLGLPLDNLLRFDIDPASVTVLAVGGWGVRLAGLNERMPEVPAPERSGWAAPRPAGEEGRRA